MAATYPDLLHFGYNLLSKYKTIGVIEDENITGIEDSLNAQYLDQMLELNKYIYTTASTNHPGQKFQCFFIDFIAPKRLCLKIIQYLALTKYSYVIKELSVKNNVQEANPVMIHMVSNNDPKGSILDPRLLTDHISRIRELIVTLTDSQLPQELVPQYKQVIQDDNLCDMTIEDSDLNDESLYLVLLNILQQI